MKCEKKKYQTKPIKCSSSTVVLTMKYEKKVMFEVVLTSQKLTMHLSFPFLMPLINKPYTSIKKKEKKIVHKISSIPIKKFDKSASALFMFLLLENKVQIFFL